MSSSLRIDTASEPVVKTSTGERTVSELSEIVAGNFGTLTIEAPKAKQEDATVVHLLLSPKEKL